MWTTIRATTRIDNPASPAFDHLAHHGKRSHISAAACSAARQWHKSADGRGWHKTLAPVDWRGCCSARCKTLRPLREIFRGKRYRGKSRTVLPSQLQRPVRCVAVEPMSERLDVYCLPTKGGWLQVAGGLSPAIVTPCGMAACRGLRARCRRVSPAACWPWARSTKCGWMICGHKQGRKAADMNPNYMFVGPWQHRELIVLARHLSAFERVGSCSTPGCAARSCSVTRRGSRRNNLTNLNPTLGARETRYAGSCRIFARRSRSTSRSGRAGRNAARGDAGAWPCCAAGCAGDHPGS